MFRDLILTQTLRWAGDPVIILTLH